MKLGPVRVVMVAAAVAIWPAVAWAQGAAPKPSARFVDVATGITIDDAVKRALADIRHGPLGFERSGSQILFFH